MCMQRMYNIVMHALSFVLTLCIQFRIEDIIEKTSVIKTKILVPKGLTNTFLTGKLSKKWPKISGPKVSVIEGLHCTHALSI